MNASSHTHSQNPGWQSLGEIELPVGISTDEAIHAWLAEILASINLSSDFLGRVLKSAQESVGHAFQPNTENALSHIHISILVPCEIITTGKPWGFFHIERIETSRGDSNERHHAIDFYLYYEGE